MKKVFLLVLLSLALSCLSLFSACVFVSDTSSSSQSSISDSSASEQPSHSDASFSVNFVFGWEVKANTVYVTEEQINQLLQADDVSQFISVDVADGATLEVEFDKTTKILNFTCTSADGAVQNEQSISVLPKRMFTSHSVQGTGSPANGYWNDNYNGYYIKGMTCATDEYGNVLKNYYVYEFNATLTGLSNGSELVISSYQSESLAIRFVLRGTGDSSYLLFTDYRDNSDFLNYLELKTNVSYTEGETINFKVIHAGNSMVMICNGETLFRRTLASMTHSELVLNYVNYPFVVNNIRTVTDKNAVLSAYQEALIGYEDPFFGDNSIGFGFHTEQAVKNEDGSIYIAGADSNTRVMGGYYHEGVPVGGHEFAVSVSIRMQNTKESGNVASKSEFQLYKDSKNSVKFHMFRYPTNNTLMAYEQKNGVQTDIAINKGNFPTGTDYTYNIIALYKLGHVELWLKDSFETNSSSAYPNYTLVYQGDFDWNHCGFAFAMRQYADTTWSDWNVYYNQDFYDLYQSLHGEPQESSVTLSGSKDEVIQSTAFIKDASGNFLKPSYVYDKAFVADGNNVIYGNKWMVSALVNFKDYKIWGQGEFQFYQDESNAIRYVFEHDGFNFQVFTEEKHATYNWQNWKIVRRPSSSTPAYWKMTVVNDEGNIYLLINDEVWHEYKDSGFNNLYAVFGGKDASVKISNLKVTTDSAKIDDYVENMEYYVYESNYESRIRELETEYANAEKGGIVLAGSSSVDFWDTWQEDLGTDVLAYNVGIGGTTTYDWQIAYDRLIKPMNPSQILLFLGGNDVNGLGETGEATALRLQAMLELMHADFPSANIIYILSMPVPNNYNNGTFTLEYGRMVSAMKVYGLQNASWLKTVDFEPYLTQNNQPVAEYFRPDNIHLTEEGYKVWTSQLKPLLVHEDTVLKDTSNNVIAGSWTVETNDDGNKVYTPTADNAIITFKEIQLENNAFVEFDMNILATGSSIAGVLFGLDSPDSNNGFCIGFASNGNPGDAWITNGTANGYGSGDTVAIKITYEVGQSYHIRIECNIENGEYNLYINGEFARRLYFQVSASNPDKATLHTGPYFGLFGGNKGGRIQYSNITVGVVDNSGEEPEEPTEPDEPDVPDEPEVPEELPYNVIAGEWEVTESDGNKVYTPTADNAIVTFKEIQLENNAFVEFDMNILATGSSIAGVLFGLESPDSNNGFCIGFASNGNPGDAWITNGTANGYGSGDTVAIKITYEVGQSYHIRIECNIENGEYNLYINGEFARRLYFQVSASNPDKATLHTGPYFGLFGGNKGGRIQYSNITVGVVDNSGEEPEEPTEPDVPDEPEVPEELPYNVIAGEWEVTENDNGNKVYTSTTDKAYLVFKDILLENNAIVEFDMTILVSSSYTAGALFGLASNTATDGLCVGRASSSNPGSGWMQNGVQGTTGGGETTHVKMTELNVVYHIRIECDIENGVYNMYIDGEFARKLYFTANTTDNKTANDVLHTGPYFGLYGGQTGRTRFENIQIITAGETEPETPDEPTEPETPDEPTEPQAPEYNVLAGEWEVTQDENGVISYTSTANKSYLVFKDILLENNAVIEFDLKILQSSSYTAGVLFGLASNTATDGLCVGRVNNGNPGSAWIQNGVQGTYGEGDDTLIKMTELNVVYHIKIECDIENGVYNMYINGEFARKLYFTVDTTDTKTANDVLHTGAYFGLYGGATGRTQFSNITISSGNGSTAE